MQIEQALNKMMTDRGQSVTEESFRRPVLLVFLRHFGCTFCREALAEIAAQRADFNDAGVEVILVHMTNDEVALPYFKKYELEGIQHVGDPDCTFYKAFGLLKGNFNQLFGLQSWIRGFDAGLVQGHWVGVKQLGDGFQMPGAFTILKGKVVDSFIHKVASDKPNYKQLIKCCEVPAPNTSAGTPAIP